MMNADRLVFLFTFLATGLAACGGSPTRPDASAITFGGTVKFGSAGLASVQVSLSGDASRTTVTDSQGRFSFADVRGKSFVVTPALDGYAFTPETYSLESTSRTDLDFAAASIRRVDVGDTAQDLTGLDQTGSAVSLYSYRGKVVLLVLAADWCAPCRHDAPDVEALYERYKDLGFQVLMLLVDGRAADWASEYKLTFPVIEDQSNNLSKPYLTGLMPTLVILDRTMTVRFKKGTKADDAQMLAVLEECL